MSYTTKDGFIIDDTAYFKYKRRQQAKLEWENSTILMINKVAELETTFSSTRIGWAELADEWIDSSITASLTANPHIAYSRLKLQEHIYVWNIFISKSKKQLSSENHLGYIQYRRIHNENSTLGYGVNLLIVRDKPKLKKLRDAATAAKLRVDSDHNVGVFHPLEYEDKVWDKIGLDKKSTKLLKEFIFGYSYEELAFRNGYTSANATSVVKNKLSRMRKKHGEHIVPYYKDRYKFASQLGLKTTVNMSGLPKKIPRI